MHESTVTERNVEVGWETKAGKEEPRGVYLARYLLLHSALSIHTPHLPVIVLLQASTMQHLYFMFINLSQER